jgi:hypothetical protein
LGAVHTNNPPAGTVFAGGLLRLSLAMTTDGPPLSSRRGGPGISGARNAELRACLTEN